jgi:antitoxin MazE
MAARVKLGARGTVTIPKELRANMPAGEQFEVVRRPDGVIELRPQDRDPDQAWFWTERWQKMEREADEDIAAGRWTTFDDGDSFVKHLEAVDAELGDD